MTVDDICNLVEDMTDLLSIHARRRRPASFSSSPSSDTLEGRLSSPPQSISRSTSIAAYLLRLRALNISGPVLAICSLNEALRREIGMSPTDWQMFSQLVAHLKRLEGGYLPQHTCQCARSMGDLASSHRHWHQPHQLHQGAAHLERLHARCRNSPLSLRLSAENREAASGEPRRAGRPCRQGKSVQRTALRQGDPRTL